MEGWKEKARQVPGLPRRTDGVAETPRAPGHSIRRADVRRLLPLGARRHIELDSLTFGQGLEALPLDRGEMGREFLAAVFRSGEAETLGIVEPLNSACCHVLKFPE